MCQYPIIKRQSNQQIKMNPISFAKVDYSKRSAQIKMLQ